MRAAGVQADEVTCNTLREASVVSDIATRSTSPQVVGDGVNSRQRWEVRCRHSIRSKLCVCKAKGQPALEPNGIGSKRAHSSPRDA